MTTNRNVETVENSAAARLEKLTSRIVNRLREAAVQIERQAGSDLACAHAPTADYHTYARAAGHVVQEIHTMLFNLNAAGLIDAASEADRAHAERAREA